MKKLLGLVLLLAAVLPFADLGHPLWEVDDARYAEVPREMHASGDWLRPTLNAFPYVEKPPLIYWLGAASYSIFGVSEAAARLPLAVLALLQLFGVYWLGSWLFSKKVGTAAAIILGTCVQFMALSHLITPDMAVSTALLWSTAFLLRAARLPKDARWAGPAAGACMALAFLAKGLIGVVFPGAWAVLLYALFPDLRAGLRAAAGWRTWLAVGAVLVPWIWVMETHHPGFLRFFIVEQHFQRFLTPKYNRPGPIAYFVPVELLGLLPWTPLVFAALAAPVARWKGTDPRARQLWLWVALVFAFFSVSKSKLPTYILPLFAHQALLGAWLLDSPDSFPGARAWMGKLGVFLGALLAAAALVVPFVLPALRLPPGSETPAGILAAAFALALAFGAVSAARGAGDAALVRGGAAGAAALAAALLAARAVEPMVSARPAARAILKTFQPGDRILSYGVYLHGIPFYTGVSSDLVNYVGEFHYAQRDARFAGRFLDDRHIRELPAPGRTTYVVFRRIEAAYLPTLAGPGELKGMEPFGQWVVARF